VQILHGLGVILPQLQPSGGMPILDVTCIIGTPTFKKIIWALNFDVGEKFQRQRVGPELSHLRSYFETGVRFTKFLEKKLFITKTMPIFDVLTVMSDFYVI